MSSLTLSVGTDEDHERFFKQTSITGTISNTYFSKDIIEEILSTSEEVVVKVFFNGTGVENLTAGKIGITIERVKLIDPTVLKNPNINTQIPVGVIMNYVFNDLPSGYFRLDGGIYPNANQAIPTFVNKLITANAQLISEKLIIGSDEWDRIYNANGSCGKFCWRGANLQFPAINCFIKGLTDLTQLSKFESDTMRPMTGDVCKINEYLNENDARWTNGAFYRRVSAGRGNGVKGGSADNYTVITMDTTRLGSSYNGSETQPKHIKYPYIISVYNKVQSTSEFNIQDLLDATIYKANSDMDNVSENGFKNIAKNIISYIFPNYSMAQAKSWNTLYTAEVCGWLDVSIKCYNSQAYLEINGVSQKLGGFDDNDGHGDSIMVPISKGDKYKLYGSYQEISRLVFIPCKGETL